VRNAVVLILIGTLTWYVFFRQNTGEVRPGIQAPEPPAQRMIASTPVYQIDGYRITPVAEFELQARVLAKRNYRFDREAALSPVDLALGWGRMSGDDVLRQIDIRQRNRWYYWRSDDFSIPRREIETSSANMHMIPSDEGVAAQLKSVGPGDIVTIKGKLVSVEADDGWRWSSSLSRVDTGDGSCELIWLESIFVHPG
jgi:hypothetical protein